MQSHDTLLIGTDENDKIVFIKTYDHSTQHEEMYQDLKEVKEAGLEWRIGGIETFIIKEAK